MTPDQIQQLAQLPVYGLMALAIFTLWKAYTASQDGRVNDLKSGYEASLAELRTRIYLLEDNAHMPHPSTLNASAKPYTPQIASKDLKLD